MSGTVFPMVSPYFARAGGLAAAYRASSTSIALRQHCTVPPKIPQSGRAWEPAPYIRPHHPTGSVWEPTPTPEPSSVGPTIINVIGVSISDCLHLSGE
jgi:hypothetical protein